MLIKIKTKYKVCLKPSLEDIYIILLVLWSTCGFLIDGTKLSGVGVIYQLFSKSYTLLTASLVAFVLLKTYLQFERSDFKIIILEILAVCTLFFSAGDWVFQAVFIICGTKYVNMKKALRYVFYFELLAFFIIVILGVSNVIPNVVLLRSDGTVRYALGFYHPNILASRIFQLIALYLWVKSKKISGIDIVLVVIVGIITYKLTDSKTATIIIFACVLLVLALWVINYEQRKKINILKCLINFFMDKLKYLVVFIFFFATFFVIKFEQISNYMQGTLASRVDQALRYFHTYGISFFGKALEINSNNEDWYANSNLFTLDNGYMYLLLGYGIIFFTLFVFGEGLLIWKLAKEKEYLLLGVITLYAIYGFSETIVIRVSYNFTLLFLSLILWKNVKCRTVMQNRRGVI